MSLVTLFPHLESLQLSFIYVDDLESPCPPPERQTFKGSLIDWNSHTEQFYRDLAEHDLQYREMHVSGVDWLLDTPYNTCLVKCSERLESFGIYCGGGAFLLSIRGQLFKYTCFKDFRTVSDTISQFSRTYESC